MSGRKGRDLRTDQAANPFVMRTCHCAKQKGLGVATQALDCNGEPVGIRTRDLLIKSQLLYQLSYRPTIGG